MHMVSEEAVGDVASYWPQLQKWVLLQAVCPPVSWYWKGGKQLPHTKSDVRVAGETIKCPGVQFPFTGTQCEKEPLLKLLPKTQLWQTRSDVTDGGRASWRPAPHTLHGVHAVLLPRLNVPDRQEVHWRSDVEVGCKRGAKPAAHTVQGKHSAAFGKVWYVPIVQAWQAKSLVGVPIAVIYCPAEQLFQWVHVYVFLLFWKVLGGQGLHTRSAEEVASRRT